MLIKTLEDKTPLVHPTAFVSEAAYVVGDDRDYNSKAYRDLDETMLNRNEDI